MPKNPSKKQIEASRKNLRGHYGPKTEAGKRASAANGARNRGVSSVKTLVQILAKRPSGINPDSLYAHAGCLTCPKNCIWRSFTPHTRHEQLPHICLTDALQANPSRCFYYLDGLCAVNLGLEANRRVMNDRACVLDQEFVEEFKAGPGDSRPKQIFEVRHRLHVLSVKKEIGRYLREMRIWGGSMSANAAAPRAKHVLHLYRNLLLEPKFCVLEPWRSARYFDETQLALVESDF